MQTPDLMKVPIDDNEGIVSLIRGILKETDWVSLIMGIIVGWIFTHASLWYDGRDKTPYDWCWNLPESTAIHCTDLYYQSIEALKEESKRYPDQNCYQGLRGVECD
jgi:hypothetical protein